MQSLKQFRETNAKRYRAKEVARYLGVSEPTYAELERNQSKRITPDTATKLGDYFGVDGDIFLTSNTK